uniref:U3 small nucleolar RNA-associated protein 11 n=1 Tax=Ascaris lumbricoides TaxID=6252 RepID=A0A0M3HMQ6_ASCLU
MGVLRPEARAHLGHLEKRKDYLQRAKDYNEKKEKLRKLKRAALNRNPDEFHFHMVRSHLGEDGVHHELPPEPDEDTKLQKMLANVKDLNYVRHRLNIENRKIEKLKAGLHFADIAATKNQHTIFVDTEEEVQYFDTPEELIDRRYNRPRISTLEKCSVVNALSKRDVQVADRERRAQYSELLKRMRRADELRIVVEKLEVRKNIADRKKNQLRPKQISKGEPMKARVFQWTYERKK